MMSKAIAVTGRGVAIVLAAVGCHWWLAHQCVGASAGEAPPFRVRLDPGHPWRPPFGLGRVGRPTVAVVESTEKPPADTTLAALRDGREVERHALAFPERPPYVVRVSIAGFFDELTITSAKGSSRHPLHPAEFGADAEARPAQVVNPVDLGTILVPSGWLLLGPGQAASLDVAALSRTKDLPDARLRIRCDSAPMWSADLPFGLRVGIRERRRAALPPPPLTVDRDTLHIAIEDGHGRTIWEKAIPVMMVSNPPRWPKFGASKTKLRFDAPISVRDPKTGAFSTLPYDRGWDRSLDDVVVSLPNGARFVFWRGSSYIPFWAGRHNTGACYEWAEIISQPSGAVDCVEPLMDKELRYGRVAIVESTAARVHVRWTYQSVDLLYKVWGDEAVEDYYFYPDGYGTRVVHLKADPKNDYELNEFIILAPQDAYPFAVLPTNLVDALTLDGRKHEFRFPHAPGQAPDLGPVPAIYRLRLGKGEENAAVCFNPNVKSTPRVVFGPFSDGGQVVTPCYWGSHWPLARGNATGNAIDGRIHLTPSHNSVMSWAGARPEPIRSGMVATIDTLGRSRTMTMRTWAWLIGMTDDPDDRLVARARSFATPPSLDVRGAKLDFDAYVPERRAIRLRVEDREVAVAIKPGPACVNPAFELAEAPTGPIDLALDGRALGAERFAWDGKVLWLDATIEKPAELRITWGGRP